MDKKQRLLDTISPKNYLISLTPNLEKFTFLGEEELEFELLKATNVIKLHGVDLKVEKAVLFDSKNKLDGKVEYNKKEKTITFKFAKEISSGEKKLQITYSGIINDELKGWYKSVYEVNGKKKYLASSHFEEIGARQVFPCIDDPAAKAVFKFTLRIEKGLTAISNTLPISEKEDKGLKIIEFAPTPKMSTYPLVLIVGEFEANEKKAENGVLVRVLATPGKKHLTDFALSTASKMIVFYEKYFDIKYPLPKLDFIAIPDFDAGAMENWGAVTAREVAILVDNKKSAAVNKQWVATVIAHEISHMWFGDLVTLEWWTYLWLNEGFASYMEYIALNEFFPDWKIWEQFAVLTHNRALGMDSLENTHAIETEVTDLDKLPENFDEISYSKGASVIYMLASFLGEDKFKKGVREYLKKYSYSNATSEDLWTSLEKASQKPVRKIMHGFISSPGHPVILLEKKNNKLNLSQEKFFANPNMKSTKNSVWEIPFSAKDDSKTEKYLMDKKELAISYPNSWIKLNSEESSFVRVVYTKELYQLLKKPIEDKALSAIDRMGIIRDAFDGAEAGYLSSNFALDLANSYKNEDSYIVWVGLLGRLGKIETILQSTDLYPKFKEYGREILSGIGAKLGFEKLSSDTHGDILLRGMILSVLGRYEEKNVISKAQEIFEEFVKNKKIIDSDIRGAIYRIVAQNGKEREFEIFREMYIKEELHEEKNRIGAALVMFGDKNLVRKALEFSLSKDVRIQDIGRFIMIGFDNEVGAEVTWNFVKENWEYLIKKHEGQIGISWLIEGAANFTSKNLRDDFDNFFKKNPNVFLSRTIKQVLEKIDSNIAWATRDLDRLREFFKRV
ncbi:MAG TPA: M1 family metallopeptidase [Patescibacteria group bacterium]